MQTLREEVFHDLQNALENGDFEPGQGLYGSTVKDIAHDLQQCSGSVLIPYADFDVLVSHVQAWMDLQSF